MFQSQSHVIVQVVLIWTDYYIQEVEDKDLGVSDKFNLVLQVARKVQVRYKCFKIFVSLVYQTTWLVLTIFNHIEWATYTLNKEIR